jgi:hypothetical protein
MISPSVVSHDMRQEGVENMKNHYGCRPAVLSQLSALKQPYHDNEPLKLTIVESDSNENNTCLTAKEPM